MTRTEILERYSDYLIEEGKEPATVYKFAKNLEISEEEFYVFFSGFQQIDGEIVTKLWDDSLRLARTIEGFDSMSAKEQLLNFYYIFFENLKMNRSLILLILKKHPQLSVYMSAMLRGRLSEFTDTLNFNQPPHSEHLPKAVLELKERGKNELLWKHFLSVIMFWIDDHSSNFQNTDLFIEKTIDTGFEVAEYNPANKIIDLAKFIWKEKNHKL